MTHDVNSPTYSSTHLTCASSRFRVYHRPLLPYAIWITPSPQPAKGKSAPCRHMRSHPTSVGAWRFCVNQGLRPKRSCLVGEAAVFIIACRMTRWLHPRSGGNRYRLSEGRAFSMNKSLKSTSVFVFPFIGFLLCCCLRWRRMFSIRFLIARLVSQVSDRMNSFHQLRGSQV